MSDAAIAAIGRRLAEALARAGRERTDADRKQVAMIQTELCAAVLAEEREQTETQESEQ